MCGITAYCGKKEATPILVNGLKHLEYRGYDSAGIACLSHQSILTRKTVGRLSNLENLLNQNPIQGTIGIGHTRWATHGKPSNINSHPHHNSSCTFSIVHNGIIENYKEIKHMLIAKGYQFVSQTDSEVIAHLLDCYFQGNVFEAFCKVLDDLKGSYAICMLTTYDPDHLYVSKKDSPLIIGKTNDGFIAASDIPALLDETQDVYFLEDNESAIFSCDHIEFYNKQKEVITKSLHTLNYQKDAAKKDGYDTYMLKEIYEQPQAIYKTLQGRIQDENIIFDELENINFHQFDTFYFVACGTAYHACLCAGHILQSLIHKPITVYTASEFRYNDLPLNEKTLVIAVSQSGETADTLSAIKLANEKATTLSITNVIGSSIARASQYSIYTRAGIEIAVASSKAYTTQLALLLLLDYYIASQMNYNFDKAIFNQIMHLPQLVENILKDHSIFKEYAHMIKDLHDVYFIGRSLDYASVLEGSLKLKEVSYIHSEAYLAGELKHGPIALIEQGTVVIALACQPHIIDKTMSNIEETIARGANVILFTTLKDTHLPYNYTFESVHPHLMPILTAIPFQLIAYECASLRGLDVDKPRNLAKSVTVE